MGIGHPYACQLYLYACVGNYMYAVTVTVLPSASSNVLSPSATAHRTTH